MASTDNLEERLDRLEAGLEQVLGLLRMQQGAAPRSPGLASNNNVIGTNGQGKKDHDECDDHVVASAYGEGVRALSTTYGDATMRESVAELVMRLGEPETLASVTRVIGLLPELEYALNAVAAGPTLLDEGLELARERMREAGASDHELQRRIDSAANTLLALSEPKTTRSLGRLAQRAPALEPVLDAAAQASAAFSRVEGEGAFTARLVDALVALADAETLDALTRIAGLAPQIEYAVNALAAGPVLLEEGLEFARERLAESGVDDHQARRRVDAALRTAMRLSERPTLDALAQLAQLTPTLTPVASGAARAFAALGAVEGEAALADRFAETLVRIAEPEVLDSLTRIASLTPQIEYAVNALAAGPALLEEGLELVRGKLAGSGVGDLDRRIAVAGELLIGLSEPASLAALAQLGAALPAFAPVAKAAAGAMSALAAVEGEAALEARLRETLITVAEPEVLDAITRIASLAPKLEYATYFLAAGPELLEEGLEVVREFMGDAGHRDIARNAEAVLAAGIELTEPKKLEALVSLANAVDLDRLAALAQNTDLDAMLSTLEQAGAILAEPDKRAAIVGLLELAPQLERPLRALPVQPATIHVLSSLNEAVESATANVHSVGLFGTVGALRDPQIQRALGFMLEVAKRLGHALEQPIAALPAESSPADASDGASKGEDRGQA
ncbi:DUF1641 domain-containing protein [Pseudenhygromyxa sp. WMMC2535]|uniref:DUF1641 domain-containing protein n=1 Tax=Pseudenhygromyxa sp. WMMC2535 TaxID=2712867 RepID=UPI0015952148|nr:DUF1641 domain-containing protein [Pseudenhygromyxa sp. WMMC2535]NVB40872.1 DUF1641 domain-containing protein [Pseudenhygromyxa sp. WMMC2535]